MQSTVYFDPPDNLQSKDYTFRDLLRMGGMRASIVCGVPFLERSCTNGAWSDILWNNGENVAEIAVDSWGMSFFDVCEKWIDVLGDNIGLLIESRHLNEAIGNGHQKMIDTIKNMKR